MTAELGAMLRRHRERAGLSQGRLAALAGVDLSHLNRIEGGRKSGGAATLGRLARALALSPAEATALHMAAGHLPPGLDERRLLAALALVQSASVEEVEAAHRLILAARDEGLRHLAAGR